MSFVKKTSSSSSSTTVFSTGIASLDAVLTENTGGLSPGSVMLILEDHPRSSNNHTSQILRCVISEGIHTDQPVYFESADGADSPLLTSLPERVTSDEPRGAAATDKLSIAWRYKHLQVTESAPLGNNTRSFAYDLGRHLSHAKVSVGIGAEIMPGSRLVIHGLGSTWMHGNEVEWMMRIRSLCIAHRSVAAISVPPYLVGSDVLDRLIRLSQVVIQLQPIVSDEYQGLLRLVKPMRATGSLRLHLPDTLDLAYRCKRGRRFVVERYHLPPELGSEPSRTTTACKTDF